MVPRVEYVVVGNIPHGRRKRHAGDMPQSDESLGRGMIADRPRAHDTDGCRADRVQNEDMPLSRQVFE